MSNPSDANVSNPKEFSFAPVTTDTDGDAITPDDYTLQFGASDVNNTLPATFGVSMDVPKTDLTVGADGKIHVPAADLNLKKQLQPGVWAARAVTDLGAQVSAPSNVAFFNIPAPTPSPPLNFSVA